ncbi:MAG: triphosphoribosyl-dephospho-CoA synthase MdcB [Pseudomonadota bacterium]
MTRSSTAWVEGAAEPGKGPDPKVSFARRTARAALRALYRELATYPKPGLVSFVDSGSHCDMDASTFLRSLASLRGYFGAIARLGATGPSFEAMRPLGLAAERRMLAATGGVNTHRGAIFSLGLLAAACAWLHEERAPLTTAHISALVRERWGRAILERSPALAASHGAEVLRRYGAGGAREEAARGFPHLFEVGLPALRGALAATGDLHAAAVQCFFSVLAELSDTNLLYRGGREGLAFARAAARDFLARGGVLAERWREEAERIHRTFVARRLSPGGAADLLAASLFVHGMACP